MMIWPGLSRETVVAMIEFALTADPSPKSHHVTRLAMYQALGGILAKANDSTKRALSISGSSGLTKALGLTKAEITEAAYPEYTMLDLRFDNGEFDAVVSDQVLEHVEGSPFQAVQETARIVRSGGYIVHTTCFLNAVHGAPKDFWRFTPSALRLLVESANCDVTLVGGWGNQEVWSYIDLGFRFRQIPRNPDNPVYQLATRNDPHYPLSTWVVGRKR